MCDLARLRELEGLIDESCSTQNNALLVEYAELKRKVGTGYSCYPKWEVQCRRGLPKRGS